MSNGGGSVTLPSSQWTTTGNNNIFYNAGSVGIGFDPNNNYSNKSLIIKCLPDDGTEHIAGLYFARGSEDYGIYSGIYVNTNDDFVIKNYSDIYSWQENFIIERNYGRVGIGTMSPTSKLQVVGLPEYTDNAAALAAGLTVGAFYRTGDILKVVH